MNSSAELLSQFPQNRGELYLQAMNLRLGCRFEEALGVLERLQQLHPGYGRLYEERGHCYAALNNALQAIDAFWQAVNLNAALPASWQMLHTLYQGMGDEENAARIADRLVTLRNLPPEIIQAGSLFADGELVPAERILRIYLAQHGEHIEAMRLLGRVCIARGWRDDAELLLEAVVQRVPNYRAARADYARALLDQHQYVRSRQEIQRLLELDPGNRAYLRQYGEACIRQGDYEPGINLYRRLLGDAQPGRESAELHLWIAFSLRARGRQTEAIQGYRAAIAAWPESGEAWWGLANLKTYRFSADDIARMRSAEAAPATSLVDRYHLCFALGKALEDQKNYTESWSYYERGNALKHAEVRYLPRLAEAHVRLSKQVCIREFFEARRGWGAADQDPIFILGLTRSGSTLIEQILASHSEVEGTQELADIQRTVMALRGRATDPENPRYPGVLAELDPEDFRKFGERFMADTRIYRRTQRPFFIDKLPDNFRDIGLIRLMLPNAKIVDARREPMACCFGNLKQLFSGGQEFSYSIGDMAHYYRKYLELMRHWNEALPGWILTVQYEDLVENLEGNVRRILDFCGLRFEPACLEFHKTERNVRTASSEQVRQPISREGLDQWRNYEPWLGPLEDGLGEARTSYRD
ncbi:MAG: sulfotransferase [Steroidobacteraceae bacterium]|jgi:tetratricopeptide (TPR) repeat protein